MIKVNSEACIGCGACVAIAPDAFEFNENGVSKVIDGVQKSEAASEAAMSCPVGAITIEENVASTETAPVEGNAASTETVPVEGTETTSKVAPTTTEEAPKAA